MLRLRFYVGTHDKDEELVKAERWTQVEEYLVNKYGGYTKYNTAGAWADEETKAWSSVITEPAVVYEVITDDCTRTEVTAEMLKYDLNQSAVLYTEEIVQAKFV